MERILVIGANGQIGSELVDALGEQHGAENVIATDIAPRSRYGAARYLPLDTLDRAGLASLIAGEAITQVYQLAAMLSVTGEQEPLKAWNLNMNGLLNVLDIARERERDGKPLRVFWPSSIAAFGPHTPAHATPQLTVTASASRPASGCANTISASSASTCAASATPASSATSRRRAAAPPIMRSRCSTRRGAASAIPAIWPPTPRCP
jgi:nucleoside-diphosphate-sugar epimerase